MDRDKLPIPRPQAVSLALRAYSALDVFREGAASPEHWVTLAEVLNTVNALACLGKTVPGVSPEMLKALYFALRSAETAEGAVELDDSLLTPLGTVVCAYEACLNGLARRTVNEAMAFIDRCVEEQESMDLAAWCAHHPHPPMFSGDELPRTDNSEAAKLPVRFDPVC